MAKVQGYINIILLAVCVMACCTVQAQYVLRVVPVDRDENMIKSLHLQESFASRQLCVDYVNQLPQKLQEKGYTAASVDSLHLDSTFATIHLFLGEHYQLAYVDITSVDAKMMDQIGWNSKLYFNKPLNITQLQQLEQRILDYFENNGHPFAKVQLDSVGYEENKFYASLKVDKGPLYKIDSIRVYGTVKISSNFLQRYLGIPNGSPYSKSTLQKISTRLRELPFLQEEKAWDMTMVSAGAVVNLYLKPKRASQINVLVGLLPSSDQNDNKMLVTGEANINLRNALGSGETIGLNWQQLQIKSPRLNLAYQQPFIFKSPFGLNLGFDLLKKDSSYININFVLGVQYALSASQTGRVFFQSFRTNLLDLDTNAIKESKTLPDEIDETINNLGIDYELFRTNYRYNPRKGNELHILLTAGTRTIRKNNSIVKLSSPDFSYGSLYDTVKLNTYQFKIKVDAAHFFPIQRSSTLKLGANVGWLQSPSIYRNELFQIGGYKLLRGFDEESIYASQYTVGTVEYRFLIGQNSYLFSFVDGAWVANKSLYANTTNTFIGAGLGLAFETTAGLFNISFAAGKRNDVKFNARQSKIHLGYVTYF
ncbi:BamA/TamA family outer membrane protein [Pinibacter aurantiacus]|uniref:BamA/TamA family outer membrane protein n=1 Tax=Pinibacter aurantiacus TaxID=2851599 RepID=A0A9E2W4L6_9BACT|nr:BamA/TamA family outer membrane protein [Pinibacter aurantiacus]MBV4357934.1 BamA/TamA family outer membrane protein [Pinibacter aurantiacus]